MHPGREPVGADHRLTCIGAEAHDVGSAHSLLSGLNRACPDICCRQLLSMGDVARCNADFGERAHAGKHLQMRTTLHASADNRQHAGVRAGQKPGREGGRASRPERSDIGPVHEREGSTRLGIEQADDGLVRGDAEPLVVVKDGDQLDGDFSALLIGWHGEQKPRVGDGDPIAFRSINEA